MLHVNVQALRAAGSDVTAETPQALPRAQTASGACLSRETARRLSCDAALLAVYETADGEPLFIGRRSRTIPPSIRRALRQRDDGCRFPGCTEKHYVDAHHVHHWADGGETSLDNLVTLCRHHHRLVRERGFTVQVTSSNSPKFYSPQGVEIRSAGGCLSERRYRGNVATMKAAQLKYGVKPGSLVPDWDGKPLDLAAAVEGLVATRSGSSP